MHRYDARGCAATHRNGAVQPKVPYKPLKAPVAFGIPTNTAADCRQAFKNSIGRVDGGNSASATATFCGAEWPS